MVILCGSPSITERPNPLISGKWGPSCVPPVWSTQKATTQIAGDLGPNLFLLWRKMDGSDRDQMKRNEEEEERQGGGGVDRMVGI